mmetsp:Transcript_17466/g.23009  ORF Transcript_17466/g.23009 Transcript_17466/m.23009 type:complete len:148 (-) Transcript_17466:110-553(-)
MITCFAIVGKTDEPLFLRPYIDDNEDPLKFHSIVHSSLDMVDEFKAQRSTSMNALQNPDMYIGHLCPIEEYRVFGYITNTNIKFIAVLEDSDPVREHDLKNLFVAAHQLYVNYYRNPFAPIKKPLKSERVRLGIDRQVNSYNVDVSA